MTNQALLVFWGGNLLRQLPEIAVALALSVWVLARWQRVPASRVWALPGFLLILLQALLYPSLILLQQHWMIDDHESAERVGYTMMVVGFLWSALHALALAFLGAAIFAGRARPPLSAFPPPLPPGITPRV